MIRSLIRPLALLVPAVLATGCPSGGGGGHENDPPEALDDGASTAEDTPVNVDVLANDSDPDGDALFIVGWTDGANGTVLVEPDGTMTYVPDPDFEGADSFSYTITDDGENRVTAQVSVTVSAAGDAPVALADSYDATEDTPLVVAAQAGVLANDADVDSAGFTAVLDADVTDGTLSLAADGSFTYTPDADFHGTDSFTYHADDGAQASSAVTVTITVAPMNDTPVAGDDAYATDEDTPLVVAAGTGVLQDDTDADGDALYALVQAGPTHGVLALSADGSFTYTPAPDFNGTDAFTYVARDGAVNSAPAMVTLTVNAVNDAPAGAADAFAVAEDLPLTVPAPGVLANDTDTENDSLTAVLVAGPSNASAFTLNPDGSFSYTPGPDFHGSDAFTYRASDGALASGVTTVSIAVTPVNDAPVADDDGPYVTDEDTPLAVSAAAGVLAGDTDVDGDALHALLQSPPANGTLALAADGSFLYTPGPEFSGTDSFTYVARDGALGSAPATVTLTVNAVNDAPTSAADGYATSEDVALSVGAPGVLANDTDPDGPSLTAVLASGPAHGGLSLQPDGSFDYTPAPNFHGTDSFTYHAHDGTLPAADVTVTITVLPVNDAPAFVKGPDLVASEDGAPVTLAGWATGMSAGPADEAAQGLSFEVVTGNPALFSAQPAIDAAGTLTFSLAPDRHGATALSVTLVDDGGTPGDPTDDARSPAQVAPLTVTSVNDPPSFSLTSLTVTVDEDSGTYVEPGFYFNESPGPFEDEPLQPLQGYPLSCNIPFEVLFLDQASGTLVFRAAPESSGACNILLELRDAFGAVFQQTFTIVVTPVNDPPSFTGGGSVGAVDTEGPRFVANWATDIFLEPGESGQFQVTLDDPGDAALFEPFGQPAIDPAGNLTFDPDVPGVAEVTVVLVDDGGTPGFPGDDLASAPYSFDIVINPEAAPPTLIATSFDGDPLLSNDEAFGPSGALAPAVFTFDDPALDCSAVMLDVFHEGVLIGEGSDYQRDCGGPPGTLRILFFGLPPVHIDGDLLQFDFSNVCDTSANCAPEPTPPAFSRSVTYDGVHPILVEYLDPPSCQANWRVVTRWSESLDPASTSSFTFDHYPSFPGPGTPVVLEPGAGSGLATLAAVDDTFFAVPRDLLQGGGALYLYDFSGFRDRAGNSSAESPHGYYVCGGGGGGMPPNQIAELALHVDGTPHLTVDGSEIVNFATLVPASVAGTSDDLDLRIDPSVVGGDLTSAYGELRWECDEPGCPGPSYGTLVQPGNLVRFEPTNDPSFRWEEGGRYVAFVSFCGPLSCSGTFLQFHVQIPRDTTAPRVVSVNAQRASPADGSVPAIRPEEPLTIGFSETIDLRGLVSANFQVTGPGGPVPVTLRQTRTGGVGAPQIALRAAADPDGEATAFAPGTYTLAISGLKDLAEPQNPLPPTLPSTFEVVTLGTPPAFLGSAPTDPSVDVALAGSEVYVHVAFDDAMSAASFVDVGDPLSVPRGFRLEQEFSTAMGLGGSFVLPLKGMRAAAIDECCGNGLPFAPPSVVALGFDFFASGFVAGPTYALTLLEGARNVDGDPLGAPETITFRFHQGDGVTDLTPRLRSLDVEEFQIFPPGFDLTFQGFPVESQARFRVEFSEPDAFAGQLQTLTVYGPDGSDSVSGFSNSLELSIAGDAALAGIFDTGGVVNDVDVVVEDDGGSSFVLPQRLYFPSTLATPSVIPAGGDFTVTGTVPMPDAAHLRTVGIAILELDESGPTPDAVGVVHTQLAHLFRDPGTGEVTWQADLVGVSLPDAAPNVYRLVAVGEFPFRTGRSGTSLSAFSGLSAVLAPNVPALPFFSEYVEGTSNNKALEIMNTGATLPIDLAGCSVRIYANGSSTPSSTISLTGAIAPGDVRVLCHASASGAVLAACDQATGSVNFNGDDAVELACGGLTLDVIGQIGFDPGTAWGTAPTTTLDATLVRKCGVRSGDRTGTNPFDPASEWGGFPVDTFTDLGLPGCVP